jgi:hypothetical protein
MDKDRFMMRDKDKDRFMIVDKDGDRIVEKKKCDYGEE